MIKQRCPHCGGANAPSARWCGQCLHSLAPDSPPPTAAPSPALSPPDGPTPRPSVGAALVATALAAPPVKAPPFGVASVVIPSVAVPPAAGLPIETTATAATEPPAEAVPAALQQATWTCSRCLSVNTYAVDVCSACRASLFAPLAEEKRAARTVEERQVLVASLLPGGGFFAIGLAAAGVARLAFTVWTLIMAVALPGQLAALKALFVLAALASWGLAAYDALLVRRAGQAAMLLKSKVLIWVVGGLLMALVAGMVVAAPSPQPVSDDLRTTVPATTRGVPGAPHPTDTLVIDD